MTNSSQEERYSRSVISNFVSSVRTIVDPVPLVETQIQTGELFKDAATKPAGPLDLLYCFNEDEQQRPALGFQQVDTEQESEQMYILVYLDPRLQQSWNNQLNRYRE